MSKRMPHSKTFLAAIAGPIYGFFLWQSLKTISEHLTTEIAYAPLTEPVDWTLLGKAVLWAGVDIFVFAMIFVAFWVMIPKRLEKIGLVIALLSIIWISLLPWMTRHLFMWLYGIDTGPGTWAVLYHQSAALFWLVGFAILAAGLLWVRSLIPTSEESEENNHNSTPNVQQKAAPNQQMPEDVEAYRQEEELLVQLITEESSVSWTRLQAFLVSTSVLFAVVGLFAQAPEQAFGLSPEQLSLVAMSVTVLAMVLSVMFVFVTTRARAAVLARWEQVEELERLMKSEKAYRVWDSEDYRKRLDSHIPRIIPRALRPKVMSLMIGIPLLVLVLWSCLFLILAS